MSASSKKSLAGALVANLAIAATKFIVAGITGSSVMVAEGIHSLVDTGNSTLMLFGRWRGKHPPDARHPFGYGMELYFWSFVVAMVVFGGGGGLSIYKGVVAIVHPHAPSKIWPNFIVIAAAAVFEGASLVVGVREFKAYRREKRYPGSMLRVIRASKNPAIFLTVLEDSAALVGLAIAAAGLALGELLELPVLDGVASILIGLVLVVESLLLGYECRELMIGEAARSSVIDRVRAISVDHVPAGAICGFRTLQLGPDAILVILQLQSADALTTRAAETLVASLRRELPDIRHVAFEL